jgi:integrase
MKLSIIRSFLNYCCVKRYVLSNPAQLVVVNQKVMDHKQKETKHKPVFTDDEFQFVLANCDNAEPPSITNGFFKAALILGRDLALRLGDICNLEWDCFDFTKKTVTVWMDKTNSRVEIPMTTRVHNLIARLPSDDKKYLFPYEREMANDSNRRASLSVAFSRLFQRLGLEGYSFHCLRATMATTMANRGATMDDISEALGHKSKGVTKVYVKKEGAANKALR